MRLAMIGLGAMGLPMAARLHAAGHDLVVCDLSPQRLASAAPLGRTTSDVAVAVADADLILTVLPADQHVRAVADEIARAGRAGQVLLEFSTIGPTTMREVAGQLDAQGIRAIGIGLSRGTAAARAGTLALFVGGLDGDEAEDKRVGEVLDQVATDVLEVGPPAAAKATKLANNMILACVDIAYAEAIVLGGLAGLESSTVVAALKDQGPTSWALINQIERHVLTGDLGEGYFRTDYMAKDVRLFTEMCRHAGLPSAMARLAAGYYRGTIALGHAADYHPVVIRWIERDGPADAVSMPTLDPAATLSALHSGLRAVQTVVDLEAVRAMVTFGVAPTIAATVLAEGSAANECLPAAAAYVASPSTIALPAAASDLDAALDLAERVRLPALMFGVAASALEFEVGRTPHPRDDSGDAHAGNR